MGWEPLPGTSDPVGISDSLARLGCFLGTARPDALSTLESHWDQVIGARLASHCRLHSLRHGTLVLVCDDGAVVEQLRWMQADLIGAANSVVGTEEVVAVEIRVTPS